MQDNITNPDNEAGKERMPGEALPEGGGPPPQPDWRSRHKGPGRGWYIAAIVMGVIIVILASLYVYLLVTRRSAHPGATPSNSSQSALAAAPAAFHNAACPFKVGAGIKEGQGVRCGFLSVPEDYSRSQGPTIQLAVAIFKASSPPASSFPLLYLQGGPGGGLLNDLGSLLTSTNLSEFSQGHDLVLLDQRGTGYSKPSLACKELNDLQYTTLDENLSRSQNVAVYVQAARACHDRLQKSGIDLNAYTTIANATDVHNLIHALNYKQADLYGASYGTRLELTIMRLFPSDIRSVVLDSTVPTTQILDTSVPGDTQRVFNVLFQGCASDASCNSRYPHLQNVFYKLVDDLNAKPVTFQDPKYGPVLLNGDNFASWLFSAFYATSLIPALPEIITQTSVGDYAPLAQVYTLLILDNSVSWGMYYSVQCGEDMAFTTRQALMTAANVVRPEIRPEVLESTQADYEVCQFWGQKPVPSIQKQPVKSSLPTLVLAGEYDPITPPANGKEVARDLSHSYFFQFSGTGHGVHYTNTCPDGIIAVFLKQPSVKPDASCIATMGEPVFL